jgi:hypothetical protein
MPSPEARPFLRGSQLNWLARYVLLREHLVGSERSLLEVGSGHVGISCIVQHTFVGVDVAFETTPVRSMVPFAYDGRRLPFRDGSFHTVVSMDTLEHLPAPQREAFLAELVRVSASRVIMGSPTQSGVAAAHADDPVVQLVHKLGMPEPEWMHEHDEFGLPQPSDVEAAIARVTGDAWTCRSIPTTNDLVNLLAVLTDLSPGTQATTSAFLERYPAEVEAWFRASTFGPCNRKVFLVEARTPRTPLVDMNSVNSVLGALVCPACSGSMAIRGTSLACVQCAVSFRTDNHQVTQITLT